ncbi:hypothetical protein GXW78_07135 [Roseomonas terrae]|uniref:Carbonic anhydrase n=1 Tax=Neoroseomonas terrae TaxID=424799 RepID=A0ABS5EEI7_9PROT|nr:hypothetical protein [Neoroseomonas terrae]MBR0649431.1 hypothetical protein [Neoroseomonas terrae]
MTVHQNARRTAADTFVVSCIDPRFVEGPSALLHALGREGRYSEMRIAGAALAAVNAAQPAWGAALWENLAASRQLHGVRRVTFLNHRDCGAVNAWAGRRLADDPAEELRVHAELMNRAAAEVRRRHPDMEVEIGLMALDGSVQVLPCAHCAPQAALRAEVAGPVPARRDPEGFAELVRLRTADGALPDEAQERALLAAGVREHGLTAGEARQIRTRHGGGRRVERDVAAYLASRADARGRIGSDDVAAGARLFRRLSGGALREQDARARAARIASVEGLEPRAEGFWPFRSERWFHRLAVPA